MTTEHLLYPEWQGCGRSSAVYDGAASLALALWPHTKFTLIDSPAAEQLHERDGVLGLDSIAARFRHALHYLRASAPDVVVTVGGTCGVEAAPVAYLNEHYEGDLAVVWFDAHGDLNTPASSPSGHFHGMILRALMWDGPRVYTDALQRPIEASQIFLVGTRDLDPPEADFIRAQHVSVTPPEAVGDPGLLVEAIRSRRLRHVYLHLDLDCFRPEEVPDTLMQTAGGPPFEHVVRAHRTLRELFQVAGLSVVEYVDRGGRSLQRVASVFGMPM